MGAWNAARSSAAIAVAPHFMLRGCSGRGVTSSTWAVDFTSDPLEPHESGKANKRAVHLIAAAALPQIGIVIAAAPLIAEAAGLAFGASRMCGIAVILMTVAMVALMTNRSMF